MMKIWVKTWNEPMIPMTSRNSVVGASSGMVMCRNRAHRARAVDLGRVVELLAGSTAARPGRSTIEKPTPVQTLMMITAGMARFWSDSHSSGSSIRWIFSR